MPRARRNRAVAIAASVVLHLGLLVVLASEARRLHDLPVGDEAPEVMNIMLVPRPAQEAATPPREPLRLHRPADVSPLVAPLPAPPAAVGRPSATGPVAIHPAPLPEGPAGEIRATLRVGAPGCANRDLVGLTRAERDACDERLGRGVKTAKAIPAPIDPQIRAYYDAVAKAKAPDGPLTPQSARGAAGLFQDVAVGAKGHGPGIGCHIGFGGGKVIVGRPAHGLKLGPLPCFIVPPTGSLDPDGDVKNPDQVLRNGDKP